jgi:hypothetical protein
MPGALSLTPSRTGRYAVRDEDIGRHERGDTRRLADRCLPDLDVPAREPGRVEPDLARCLEVERPRLLVRPADDDSDGLRRSGRLEPMSTEQLCALRIDPGREPLRLLWLRVDGRTRPSRTTGSASCFRSSWRNRSAWRRPKRRSRDSGRVSTGSGPAARTSARSGHPECWCRSRGSNPDALTGSGV